MHWDQKQELWLPVKDYEGLYEVSNMGRVKSLERKRLGRNGSLVIVPERILKALDRGKGYLCVHLWKNSKMKTHLVHRLVAEAFIPNPLSLPEINHLDENPLNNRVSNLQWSDREHNINYGTRNAKVAKSMSKPVLQLTRDGQLVREWSSAKEAEQQVGFSHQNISACCLGKLKTHKGFIWRFKTVVSF